MSIAIFGYDMKLLDYKINEFTYYQIKLKNYTADEFEKIAPENPLTWAYLPLTKYSKKIWSNKVYGQACQMMKIMFPNYRAEGPILFWQKD